MPDPLQPVQKGLCLSQLGTDRGGIEQAKGFARVIVREFDAALQVLTVEVCDGGIVVDRQHRRDPRGVLGDFAGKARDLVEPAAWFQRRIYFVRECDPSFARLWCHPKGQRFQGVATIVVGQRLPQQAKGF